MQTDDFYRKKTSVMKAILFIFFLGVQTFAFGQTSIHFGYDAAGNRISTFTTRSGAEFLGKSQEQESCLTNIVVYPNPSSETIFLKFDNEHGNHAIGKIYSIEGTLLIEKRMDPGISEIDISELAQGLYFIKVSYEGNSKTFKFIKEL